MVKAIVGANWGDEGKGKITDMLAKESDIIIRFQGGSKDKKSDTVLFYEPMLRISTADAKAIYEFSHDKSQPHQYSTAIALVDDEKNVDAAKDVIGKDYSAYSIQDIRETLLKE